VTPAAPDLNPDFGERSERSEKADNTRKDTKKSCRILNANDFAERGGEIYDYTFD